MSNKTPVDIFCDYINSQYGSRITNYTIPNEVFESIKKLEEDYHKVTEYTSDGYHTFKELYDFRATYNALLFNEWASQKGDEEFQDVNLVMQNTKHSVHKSWKHNDGDPFLVGVGLLWWQNCQVVKYPIIILLIDGMILKFQKQLQPYFLLMVIQVKMFWKD